MTIKAYKCVVLVLLLAITVLLACIVDLVLKSSSQRIETRGAWSAIADFQRTRDRLSKMQIDEDVAYLQAYSHMNTTTANKSLDMIVELERKRIISDLIGDLRNKTGIDLGNDSEKWIQKFSQQTNNPVVN